MVDLGPARIAHCFASFDVTPAGAGVTSFLVLVDAHELVEHRQCLGARALEGVAADDRAVAAAIANVARVLIDRIGPLGSATRKHDDAAAIEARLNDMADAIRLFGPVGALIRLLRVLLDRKSTRLNSSH